MSAYDFTRDTFDISEAIEAYEDLENEDAAYRTEDEIESFQALKDFLEGVRGLGGDYQWRGDWFPRTFIEEEYFPTYAEELASDIGAIPADAKWPANHIDWAAAADELKTDYASVEFNGKTYLYR